MKNCLPQNWTLGRLGTLFCSVSKLSTFLCPNIHHFCAANRIQFFKGVFQITYICITHSKFRVHKYVHSEKYAEMECAVHATAMVQKLGVHQCTANFNSHHILTHIYSYLHTHIYILHIYEYACPPNIFSFQIS